LDWDSKSIRMQKDNNYNMVQEELPTLVRKLAKSATAPKNDQKRDKEEDKQEEPSSKEPYAKKPKVANISSSMNDLDNKAIAGT
jgi:Sec-independent protein translocase protein TatA